MGLDRANLPGYEKNTGTFDQPNIQQENFFNEHGWFGNWTAHQGM